MTSVPPPGAKATMSSIGRSIGQSAWATPTPTIIDMAKAVFRTSCFMFSSIESKD
jgi:hypothetical protein